jgi:hypothetical protein
MKHPTDTIPLRPFESSPASIAASFIRVASNPASHDDFSTADNAFVTRASRSPALPPMHVSTHARISLSINEAAV